MSDVQRLDEKHIKRGRPGYEACGFCEQSWPCDAHVLAREVEALKADAASFKPTNEYLHHYSKENLLRAEAAERQLAEVVVALSELVTAHKV